MLSNRALIEWLLENGGPSVRYRPATELLDDALAVLGNRRAAVCLEITKMFEQVERGYLADLADSFRERTIKGEVTVVIAGSNPKFLKPPGVERRAGGK